MREVTRDSDEVSRDSDEVTGDSDEITRDPAQLECSAAALPHDSKKIDRVLRRFLFAANNPP